MFRVKQFISLCRSFSTRALTVFGQWSAANSGTTNNLNGAHLLDSGVGFVVGDAGTIVKTTDAGMTWSPLHVRHNERVMRRSIFSMRTQGVAVGEQGLILRTDGWRRRHGRGVTSGVKDDLRSVLFSGVNGISGGDSQTILYSTDSGAFVANQSKRVFRRRFPGAHMLSPSIGFVAGSKFDLSTFGRGYDRWRCQLGVSRILF